MPNNWKTYKLSEALEIKYGKDHKKVQDGTIPIYGTGGIMRYGNQALYDKETILIPRKGSLNNIFYLNEPFWSVDTIFWSKINEDVAFPKYLFYNLKVLDFASMDVGSAIPSLTTELLKKIEIKLPSLEEQKSITSILSAIDDKIEINLAINKTLEEMAMALYKHWFVDFGPFKDGEFVESELGMIPKGWEVKTIGNIVSVLGGYAFKSAWFQETGVKVLKIKNINNNIVDISNCNCISEEISKSINQKFKIIKGDFLIAMTGAEVGKVGVVPDYGQELWLNQRVGKIADKEIQNASVLIGKLLQTDDFYKIVQGLAYGSAQPNISTYDIESIKIALPSNTNILNELISEFVNSHEITIQNLTENQSLTQLRDTFLPKLISGEVRLKEFRETITN